MVKKYISRVILGVISSLAIMAAGFYFFIFANPLHLYQVNILNWIPVLISFIALYASGKINSDTPGKILPLLFIPFVVFDLFNFLYFPFIIVLTITGILALLISRDEVKRNVKIISSLAAMSIFIYYLLSHPLIIENEGFTRDLEGEFENATIIWLPSGYGTKTLPTTQTLVDADNNEFNLNSLTGKTHFIAVWATWCAPCLEEKPRLDSLKTAHQGEIGFVDISIDEDKDKWRAFVEKNKPQGVQLISKDVDKTRRALTISSLPRYFIVNAKGEYKAFTSLEKAGKVLSNTFN